MMFQEPDVNVIRAWPPDLRYRWDFYLDRFETPFARLETLIARLTMMMSSDKNKKLSDFMLPVPEFIDDSPQAEFEQSQLMIAQMMAYNETK